MAEVLSKCLPGDAAALLGTRGPDVYAPHVPLGPPSKPEAAHLHRGQGEVRPCGRETRPWHWRVLSEAGDPPPWDKA